MTLVSSYTYEYVKNYKSTTFDNYENVTVIGRLNSFYKYNDNYYFFKISNLKIINEDNKIFYPAGNMSVGVSDYTGNIDFDVGYLVTFKTKIEGVSLVENDEINFYTIKNGIKYKNVETVYLNSMILVENSKTALENFKDYNLNLIINNFGETKGNIVFSILFGDKSFDEPDFVETFKISGVAHIFSVSGLHITLIVLLLMSFLKKLNIKPIASYIILFVFLLAFCYICNFSSTVLRASLMALCLILAKILGRKNDQLNTISLAGLIILVFFPLNFFDAGFQMSFAAVFGMILFSNIFNQIKFKNRILKDIVFSVLVCVSAQVALFPIISKYYGLFSTYSILANLLALPIFSIFYCLLFVFNIVVLILPFFNFLFALPSALFTLFVFINKMIASLPYSTLPVYYFGGFFLVFYYLILFFISKFVMIKPKIKTIFSCVLLTIFCCSLFFLNFPTVSTQNEIYFSASNSDYVALLATKFNKFYLIDPVVTKEGISSIKDKLKTKKISEISGVIFTTNQNFEAKIISNFLIDFNSKIYLPQTNSAVNNLESMGIEVLKISNQKIVVDDFIALQYFYFENNLVSNLIEINSYKLITLDATNFLNADFQTFLRTNINFNVDCIKILGEPDKNAFKSLVLAKLYLFNLEDEFKIRVSV